MAIQILVKEIEFGYTLVLSIFIESLLYYPISIVCITYQI